MRQSTKRLVSSVIAVGLVFGALIVFFNFIQPAYGNVNQTRALIEGKNQFIESQKSIIQKVRTLLEQYSSSEGEDAQQAVNQALPLAPEAPQVLAQINGLVALNKLVPRSYTVSIEAPKATDRSRGQTETVQLNPVGSVLVRVQILGTYGSFKGFVRNLETNVRLMDVESFNFQPFGTPEQRAANPDVFSYELSIRAYYQVQ